MKIDPQVMQLWFHYEEIAMHFNQLTIQYRLQLLGGLGALSALLSYLVGHRTSDDKERTEIRPFVATSLLVIFFAAALLDVFYYRELLEGAVAAILELEAKHPEINMSTSISNRFVGHWNRHIVLIVYGIVLVFLLAITIWSWIEFCKKKTK